MPAHATVSALGRYLWDRTGGASRREIEPREIRNVLAAYFEEGIRPVSRRGRSPTLDVYLDVIGKQLRAKYVHDEDYLVFGCFRDPGSTILDVGANYGYSAISLWSVGARSRIVSFEPNPALEPFLRRIAKLRPGRFDYRISGVGDTPGTSELVMPVVNGVAITALATALARPDLDGLCANICAYVARSLPERRCLSFELHAAAAPIATLDDLLGETRLAARCEHVAALKIDTEGFEGRVMEGARSTITRHKPLMMAEAGAWDARCMAVARELGYSFARRAGRKLALALEPAPEINTFFVHPERYAEYRRIGLLETAGS